MTGHHRKYGENESHPIPLWNGVFEHFERIGEALWEFAWCIDKITEERDGVGLVFGGAPVKISAIVSGLKGSKKETVRLHMASLEAENYIRRRRTPYGHVIEVLNSRKFGIWKRPEERPKNTGSLLREKHENLVSDGERNQEIVSEKPKKLAYKEDSAVDRAIRDAAVASADGLDPWKALGSKLPMGTSRFQALWGHHFATRNGNLLSEAMERCIVSCQEACIPIPRPFYDAKRKVERSERDPRPIEEIPELEAESWSRK